MAGMIFLSCLVALLQDAPAESRGREYLERLGKNWSARPPEPSLWGIYIGKSWLGQAKLTVTRAPEGSVGVLEATFTTRIQIGAKSLEQHERILLNEKLEVVFGTKDERDLDKQEKRVITTKGGRWKRVVEKRDLVFERESELLSYRTWEPANWVMSAPPDVDEMMLYELGSHSPYVIRRRSPTRIEIHRNEGGAPDVLLLDERGAMKEVWPADMPLRIRPIEAAKIGRDLDVEATPVQPPVQALFRWFDALRRQDTEALDAVMDLDGLAAHRDPEFPKYEETRKAEFRGRLRQEFIDRATRDPRVKDIPDGKDFERIFAPLVECKVQGDEAEVSLVFDESTAFKFRRFGESWKLVEVIEKATDKKKGHACDRWGYHLHLPADWRYTEKEEKDGVIVATWTGAQGKVNGLILMERCSVDTETYVKDYLKRITQKNAVKEIVEQTKDFAIFETGDGKNDMIYGVVRVTAHQNRMLVFAGWCTQEKHFAQLKDALVDAAQSLTGYAPDKVIRRVKRNDPLLLFEIPGDCKAAPAPNAPRLGLVTRLEGESRRVAGCIVEDESDQSLTDYIDAIFAAQKKFERKAVGINNAELVFTAVGKGGELKYYVRIIRDDKRIVRLHWWCAAADWELFKDDFQRSLSTLRTRPPD